LGAVAQVVGKHGEVTLPCLSVVIAAVVQKRREIGYQEEAEKREEELGGGGLDGIFLAKGVLAGIGDVQETILILVFLIDRAHQRSGRWQDLIDEDEDGLLGGELDALADYVDELTDGEVSGY